MRAALRLGQQRLQLQASRAGQVRHASLTGAISRGAREAQKSAENRRGSYDEYNRDDVRARGAPLHDTGGRRGPDVMVVGSNRSTGTVQYLTEAPRTVPYTAADSEFLYGLHSVEAAIKARRRTLHKLYVYVAEDGGARSEAEDNLLKLATRARVKIVRVGGPEWKQKLSQLANGRAHNGFVLEASPVPTPLIKSLDEVEHAGASWSAQMDAGSSLDFEPKSENRFPLLLLLDGLTDTGNIGAILRSVYFFGVDGVIRPEFGSTSTAVMLKSSAGAAENVPLFRTRHDSEFISSSQANGWHIATAVAPDEQVRVVGSRHTVPATNRQTPEGILTSKPVILILGNEGEGVRPRISKLSDSFMSIQDASSLHPGLDSLNVSIAAAILMRDLVKPSLEAGKSKGFIDSKMVALLGKKDSMDEDLF